MKQPQINRAYMLCFGTPDGKIVLDDLLSRYGRRSIVKKANGVIDPNAVMIAVGELKPITFIEERIEDGKLAR